MNRATGLFQPPPGHALGATRCTAGAAHAAENYAWWVQRVRRTFELVDIVRIDHFRGFADYWEIPAEEPTAIHGRWLAGPGAALFEAIRAALGDLPIIAEDLGLLTPEVTTLRRKFDLPGMRILHFAFGGSNDNNYLPHNYDANTVVYTGTHDNNTSRGWWQEASDAERQHVREYLSLRPEDESSIHWELIRAACACVADTAIHPMQDVLGLVWTKPHESAWRGRRVLGMALQLGTSETRACAAAGAIGCVVPPVRIKAH